MLTQLKFLRDGLPLFQVQLHSATTKIGRSPHCDIVLSEPEISREHAAFYGIDTQYLVKKLDGTLRVNGQDASSQAIQHGDRIELGPWTAVVEVVDSPQELESTQVEAAGATQAVALYQGQLVTRQYVLQVQQPDRDVQRFPLLQRSVTVGADEKNDLPLSDPYVSSRHLKITHDSDGIWVHDLNSTNGTFLGGHRIREALLQAGSVLKIGRSELTLLEESKTEAISASGDAQEFQGIVGASDEMRSMYQLLQKISPTDATVLILGESGSGKELVARAVHRLSTRQGEPFVAINCGAISKELIESELFGHEKGAFTGAIQRHFGAFEQARNGTIFLDEIGELPLELQPKLLRVLENRSFRRVGGNEELKTNARIVAATHRDLAEFVRDKQFREDLFFRLFVLPIYLQPLRRRLSDLPLLVETFLKEFSPPNSPKSLSHQALDKLAGHPFPGNVRELRNVLLRSVILSKDSSIAPEDIIFPDVANFVEDSGPRVEKLEIMEQRLIRDTLKFHGGNKAKTAETLGIAKSTLFAKIKLYGIDDAKS